MMVELGGGLRPHPRADIVIDRHHPKLGPHQDATTTPWEQWAHLDDGRRVHRAVALASATVDEVYSSHFLEHIPAGEPLLAVMDEAWRVLRPGGTFTAVLPLIGCRDQLVSRAEAWADPTHVSTWWLPQRLHYFTGETAPDADYGIRLWQGPLRELSHAELDRELDYERMAPGPRDPSLGSWWGVRDGWEGVFRLVKP